jgi:hypothetical protein
MTYYVVTDDGGKSHFIEASSPGEAVSNVPGGESVRLAIYRDIEAHFARQAEQDEKED